MKYIPTYRLLFFVGLFILPFTLLLLVVDAVVVPTIILSAAILVVAIMDAYRSRERLEGIRILLPEVVRISKGREGDFNLQIENERLTVRHIRLGLAFPEEIYSPAVELSVELPEDNAHYASILSRYRKMMNALLRYQSEDGMWRQLIDNEESWKETSSTAMFGYAVAVGVREGILSRSSFATAYQKAWLSLVDYINEEGKVTDVCVGTGQGTDIDYYLGRSKATGDFHGQAPILWFAYSLLVMQEQLDVH